MPGTQSGIGSFTVRIREIVVPTDRGAMMLVSDQVPPTGAGRGGLCHITLLIIHFPSYLPNNR